MALIVLASPGGSPGVTTTALALALAWPRPVVMAECDLAGGAVLAGTWRGEPARGGGGLVRFALAAQRGPAAAATALTSEAVPLEAGEAPERFVLTGLAGPAAARQLGPAWPAVTAAFTHGAADVIADVGRFDGDPALAPLLGGAARVLLVCRPLIRQAAAARARLEMLTRPRPGLPLPELLLVGEGPYGLEAGKAFRDALALKTRATLPWDTATAAVLCDGAEPRRAFSRSPLIRAATSLAAGLARDLPAPVPASSVTAEAVR